MWSFNSGRSGKQKQENKKIEQVTDANGRRDGHAGCHDRLKFSLIGVVQIGNLFRISLSSSNRRSVRAVGRRRRLENFIGGVPFVDIT
jgi:hypothetical protein